MKLSLRALAAGDRHALGVEDVVQTCREVVAVIVPGRAAQLTGGNQRIERFFREYE
ncbi:hypothetical protein ACH4SK_04975 [Streptomyces inhibens]|uniref:hypothetical protein n=1 Tax=Streptomyces inhibens TaxID=2293571 RepID=UPI0037ACFD82